MAKLSWLSLAILSTVLYLRALPLSQARAKSLSWKLRCVRCPRDGRSFILARLRKKIRQAALIMGYTPTSFAGNRNGYHLDIKVRVSEDFSVLESTSTVQLAVDIVIMPQRRLVFQASFSGKGIITNAPKITRAIKRKIREKAVTIAVEYLRKNLPGYLKEVEQHAKNLPKGRILGKAWGKRRSPSGRVKRRKTEKKLLEIRLLAPKLTVWTIKPPPALKLEKDAQ